MKTYEYENPKRIALIAELEKAAVDNKAPIWKAVAKRLACSKKNRSAVNLGHINNCLSDKEVAVVPGKVLGSGSIGKVTIAAFLFTEGAKKKIVESGGRAIPITELIKENPKGSNVRIIG